VKLSVEAVANIAPERSQTDAVQKRCRRQDPGLLDRRKVNGRRVHELKQLYAAELVKAGVELTPLRLVQIETAAAAQVTAEIGRRRFLEEGAPRLADVVSAERRADAALERLGLLSVDKPAAQRPASGQDEVDAYLASRARATS